MSETDPKSLMEATPVANGSGLPPGDTAADTVDAREDVKVVEDGGETKGDVKIKDTEEVKQGNVNGLKTAEDENRVGEEKVTEDVKEVIVEEMKVDVDIKEAENVETVDAENVKNLSDEDVKTVEPEDVVMKEAENVMRVDSSEVAKQVDGEDVKMVDVADVNNEEAEDAKIMNVEGEKREYAKEEVKEVDTKDMKDEDREHDKYQGGDLEDEEKECDEDQGVNVEDEEKGHDEEQGEDVKDWDKEHDADQGEDTRDEDKKHDVDDEEDTEDDEEAHDEDQREEKEGEEQNEEGEVGEGKNKEIEKSKEKRGSSQKTSKGQQEDGKQDGKKSKDSNLLSSPPIGSLIDRPVREKKTVERLVEVIEKESNRRFIVEKGRGTPLKDIPNVAYRLSRKKPADLKSLHHTLFGRKGKAVDFKNHILQFSGFVWHESDEKQRAKMKEKLDKYVKDTLVDLCDLFDIPFTKANTRKEDLVVKLLDFIAAPHPTTDTLLAEKEKSTRSGKGKRMAKGSASKSTEGTPAKRSRKVTPSTKGKRILGSESEDEDDEEDDNQAAKHSESEQTENESEEAAEEDDDNYHWGKNKHDAKKLLKKLAETSSPKKALVSTPTKSAAKAMSPKHSKPEENTHTGEKVFSRKRKSIDTPKQTPPSAELETKGKRSSVGKRNTKGNGKAVEAGQSGPSKEELRETICVILKKADFNTATFSDILNKLAKHYNMDMTPRKAAVKLLIQEELTKLAEEVEEDDEDEEEEYTKNKEALARKGKKVEA